MALDQKLYVAMVGLPACGKSTLSRRLAEHLSREGFATRIFNNGDLRRTVAGPASTKPEFYAPDNASGRDLRERIAIDNMRRAQQWLREGGCIAILDATNASRSRRRLLETTLTDHPILFLECVNEDPFLREACIARKAKLPEYANYAFEDAVESFKTRIGYYESIYEHCQDEKFWMRVDTMANRVLEERAMDEYAHYAAIRELVVNIWVKSLYLVRHGQTEANITGIIGGDPDLSELGRSQARALAENLQGIPISYVFTSTRRRSLETASYVLASRPQTQVQALPDFDEINGGLCENMTYEQVRQQMPEIMEQRSADKFHFCYPGGESYAMLKNRVQRGLRRALFLSDGAPTMIVGHQAINRIILSLFLRQRAEDIPYSYIPQNELYHICCTPTRSVFERIAYADSYRILKTAASNGCEKLKSRP